jgi:hypothetical protein
MGRRLTGIGSIDTFTASARFDRMRVIQIERMGVTPPGGDPAHARRQRAIIVSLGAWMDAMEHAGRIQTIQALSRNHTAWKRQFAADALLDGVPWGPWITFSTFPDVTKHSRRLPDLLMLRRRVGWRLDDERILRGMV